MFYMIEYHRLLSENEQLKSENASLRAQIAGLESRLNTKKHETSATELKSDLSKSKSRIYRKELE